MILFSIFLNIGFLIFALYLYMGEKIEKRPHGISRRTTATSLYSQLNLSPEQEESIGKLLEPYLKDQQEMRAKNKELQKRLMELIANKEKPDRADTNKILDEITFLKGLRERSTIEHLRQIKPLLNKDQAKRFFAVLRKNLRKEME